MSSGVIESYGDERLWRDFLSAASFFSPAIVPVQKYLEIPSSEILRVIGRLIGERAAERFKSPTLEGIVSKLDGMWSRLGIGRVELERGERPAITLRDCTICGQVPEIGRLYRCAFHEAFIEGAPHGGAREGGKHHPGRHL